MGGGRQGADSRHSACGCSSEDMVVAESEGGYLHAGSKMQLRIEAGLQLSLKKWEGMFN